MPKKPTENTAALRAELAAQLFKAIQGTPKKKAAAVLGVTTQMLRLYLKGKATPGGEVIRRACDEWNLTLSIRGFEFSRDAFGPTQKRRATRNKAIQFSLLDLLEKLRNDQLEAKIVGREGDSFYLELRIKVVA